HQRVIPSGRESLRQSREQCLAVMKNVARLAVHQRGCADNLSAEDFPDRLMTQAHTKYRCRFVKITDDIFGDTRIRGSSGSGRNDNSRRLQPLDLLKRDLVVSKDAQLFAKLAEVLHEVVSKRIVVIYN